MIRSGYFFGLQSINGKAGALGQAEILYGSWEKAFSRMDDYAAVKPERVAEAARKVFQDGNKTVGTLVPTGGEK